MTDANAGPDAPHGWEAIYEDDHFGGRENPWYPALKSTRGTHVLDIWFPTEVACQAFIQAEILGNTTNRPPTDDDVFLPGHTYRTANGYFEFTCERRIGDIAIGIERLLKPWTVYPGTRFHRWTSVGPNVGWTDVTSEPRNRS